jgi:hypothetical protein
MRILLAVLFCLAAAILPAASVAQTTIDLRMTTTLGSNNTIFVTPLREVSASFIMYNPGPTAITALRATSGVPTPLAGSFDVSVASNCTIENLGSATLPMIWNIGTLAAGETKYCFVRFRGLSNAPLGSLLFGFFLIEPPENNDPNVGNNTASIFVGYRGMDYVADFQFTATKSFSTLPPLSNGVISVTAKNLGPEAVPFAAARLEGYSIGPNDTDAFFLAAIAQPDPNCFLDLFVSVCGPFGDCDVNADLYFGALAAGESRTCVFAITATRFAQGTRLFKIYGAGDGLDTNQQNNDASFDLIFTNTQFIPVGGNGWLIGLLLITGAIFLWRRQT